MTTPWYEVVPGNKPLTQGDMISQCALLSWKEDSAVPPGGENELQQIAKALRADVIVITQACDSEHQKVNDVVLCPHVPLSTFRVGWQRAAEIAGQNPTAKAWRRMCGDIANGYVWNQAFLSGYEDEELTTEIRVVHFHKVYTLPRQFLENMLTQRDKPRLRLLPPYREHLSQGFARFFMRVGLPQSIEQTW